jgi:hypothetical protein
VWFRKVKRFKTVTQLLLGRMRREIVRSCCPLPAAISRAIAALGSDWNYTFSSLQAASRASRPLQGCGTPSLFSTYKQHGNPEALCESCPMLPHLQLTDTGHSLHKDRQASKCNLTLLDTNVARSGTMLEAWRSHLRAPMR